MPGLRVGIDLASVADVRASLDRFGDRYAQRVYTAGELADTGRAPERLAARFAAKEAAVKVLAPAGNRPDWRSIEVRSLPAGDLALTLSGTAAELARAAGLEQFAVSVTHEQELAAAVVVAVGAGLGGAG